MLTMEKYEKRRQRLMQIRDEMCGGRAVDVARKIEREPSYISRMLYEDGKKGKKRIADDMVEIIEKAFSLPRGWMDGINPDGESEDIEYAGKFRDGYVPVVGEAVLGVDGSMDMIEFRSGWLQMYSADKEAYGLKVKGDSMFPRIHSGEFVLIEPNTMVHSGDEVFVRTTDGHNMIKVMTKTREGNFQLSSVNNEHKPITLEACEVAKMHYVSAIVKATRYIDHDDVPRADGEGN